MIQLVFRDLIVSICKCDVSLKVKSQHPGMTNLASLFCLMVILSIPKGVFLLKKNKFSHSD